MCECSGNDIFRPSDSFLSQRDQSPDILATGRLHRPLPAVLTPCGERSEI